MVIDVPQLEAPSAILGTIDDMWFRWVTDFGLPGPDRGHGWPVPDRGTGLRRPAARQRLPRGPRADDPRAGVGSGVHGRQRPQRPGRRDPQRASASRRTCPARRARRSPRSSPGTRRCGDAPPAPETRFVEASGTSFNTIPPNDYGYWETVDELIQQEPPSGAATPSCWACSPASASSTASRSSPTSARGRSSRTRRSSATRPRAPSRSRSDPRRASRTTRDSNWFNMLWVGGYEFLDPPPADHRRRRSPESERWSPEAELEDRVPLPGDRRHARRCACASPASARST